jgi:TP901 family phage tail tape measure protein
VALTVAQLVARLTADTSGFYRGMALANSSMIRTGGIITRVAAGAGLAVAGIGILSLRAAGNFQQSMNILQAVSGATEEQFKGLHDEAIALGRDMNLPNVSAQDAADSMAELSKAGLSVKDVMTATRGTMEFGIAANIGFADSANIVARALTAFGLSGKSATTVADLFTAAANKSTASATDIALGFQMASAQFKAGDQTIQGLTTSLTLMANAGVVGSDAGTSLKTMMNRLMAPTSKSKKLMEDLGFKVYDAAGNMKSMPNIIGSLSQSLQGMTKEQKNAALYTIFGSDAIRAARIQLAAGEQGWRKMEKAVSQGGEAQKFAEARTKGFNGAVQALFSAVDTLAIELGEHMLPTAEKVTRAMANFVNSIDPDKIAAFFGVIADGVGWIVKLVSGSQILQGILIGVAAAFATWFVIDAIVGLVGALTAAIELMGAAMLANPVVLIAAALIGLGAALYFAYTKSEEFRAIVDNTFAWLKSNVLPIIMEVVNGIRNHWGEIVQIAQTVGKLIIFWWENTWGRVLSFAIQNWNKIQAVITAVLSNIMIEIRGALKTIQGIIDVVMGVIHGDWGRAWKGIKEIVDGTLGTIAALIKNTLTRLVPAILSLAIAMGVAILKGIASGLANLTSWLYTKVTAGTESALRSVAGWVGGVAAEIGRAIVDGIISGTVGLVSRLGSAIGNAAKGALSLAKHAIGAGSPSKLAADEVGKPIGEGIIMGFLLGSADLPDKISKKLKDSLEAGKKVVDGYVDKFKEAFSRLADEALLAFDRMTEKFQTTHEKLLAAFDLKQATAEAKKQMQELVKAVSDAQLALQMQAAQGVPAVTRQEGESDADYYARQEEARQKFNDDQAALLKTYNDAVTALDEERHKRQIEKQRAALEAQATKERDNYEERRRLQRIALTDQLNQLEEFLLKHPKLHDQTQKRIIKLLNDYGIQYHAAGFGTGMAFAKGLEDSMGEILQRAHDIAEAVARVLRTGSPTKEGPMSTLDHWWDSFASTLTSGLDTLPIRRAALGIAGAMQPSAGGGLALAQSGASTTGTGAVTYVTYHIEGSLIREQDLNDRIREGINSEERRGRTVS